MMDFAEKVRDLLRERGLTQTDLAESLDTNQQQISRWLEANTPPKWAYLLKMARALGVTADYLIDPTQNDPGPAPSGLTDDERAIIDLYRDLELSRQEAIKRLATPFVAPAAPAWIPGSVRDLTRGTAPKQPRRPARADQPPADAGKTSGRKPKGKT